ncbi:MAG: glycosyltransferase family 39 protein [Candidatus Marinimicrobia bacterium]|nr:glycosyltransferase family 39 protein [Candidatus Neomarinimicrobiota bacterium]
MPIRKLIQFGARQRFLKFAAVGASGILVNEAVTGLSLFLSSDITSDILRTNSAVLFGWVVSVITNFLLNYHWTWKDRMTDQIGSPFGTLLKYYISAMAAFLVQLFTVNLLATFFGWEVSKVLVWNLFGIGAGLMVNFRFADKWVFSRHGTMNYDLSALLFVVFLTGIKLFTMQHVSLVADEAYYWEWSRQLAWGYFDHPPMVAWLIALTTWLGGHSATAVRFSAFVLTGGVSLLIYDMGRKMFTPQIAFAAIVILNTTLLYAVGAMIMTPDIPQLFFWTLALHLVWRALQHSTLSHWIIGGLVIGLGLLAKYTAILLLPAIFIYLALSRDDRHWLREPGPYLMVLCAFLVFMPVIWWNYQHAWVSFRFQLHHGIGTPKTVSLRYLVEYIGGQAAVVSPLLFLGFLAAIGHGLIRGIKENNRAYLFLSVTSAAIFLFFMLTALTSRTEANWAAPTYVAGSLLLTAAYEQTWRKIKFAPLLAGLSIAVSVGLTLLAFIEMHASLLPIPARQHPVARAVGWDQVAARVAVHRSAEGQPRLIVADRYQYAALLAYHLPDHPQVTTFAPHRRPNQYDTWQRSALLSGQEVLYITNTDTLPPAVARAFTDHRFLERVDITWRGQKLRSITLFLCTGFSGSAE